VYSKPTTLEEVLAVVHESGGECLFIGGGTDVQIYRKQELEHRQYLIDLSGIKTLKQISIEKSELVIGAMTTLGELARSKETNDWCPMLCAAARAVASPVIRYTATVGGNLLVGNRCTFYNQSKSWRESAGSCLRETGPTCLATGGTDKCYARNVSDLAPALIALNSKLEIQSANGSRVVSVSDLYLADGLKGQGGLGAGEVITVVRTSLKPIRWYYRKLRQRESIDFSSLSIGGALMASGEMRVCINGISMAPVLIEGSLATLALAELQAQARRTCKTVDNDLMPLKYRRDMIDVYLEELWTRFTS
jgi:4-hydroxybenzoyl-CoA reductase beta subunit